LILNFIISPVVMMLAVVALFAWMAVRPRTTAPLKILGLIAVSALFGYGSRFVMDAEAAATPWKLDYLLYCIDNAVGISAFSVARHLSPRACDLLFVVYQTLGHLMIVWYALNLQVRNGRPRHLVLSYSIAYGLAPLFYLLAPAYGPRHAFGALFPGGNPAVAPAPVLLAGWPNAMPSLHCATAILFVYFSGGNRFLRCFAWAYLAGTVAATLAFEHYFIDLVVAIPYTCFVVCAAAGKFRPALRHLVVVLAWLAALRFASPSMIAHPLALRLLVLATVGAGVWALRGSLKIAPATLFAARTRLENAWLRGAPLSAAKPSVGTPLKPPAIP